MHTPVSISRFRVCGFIEFFCVRVCVCMCVCVCVCVCVLRLLFIDSEFRTLRLKAGDSSEREHILTVKLKAKVRQ